MLLGVPVGVEKKLDLGLDSCKPVRFTGERARAGAKLRHRTRSVSGT